jgi:hypothetical protein
MTQRFGPVAFALAASGLLLTVANHSHSGSQFRPHLPPRWNSIMFPPHCGHIRLIIEEIVLAFGSPGIISMILIGASYLTKAPFQIGSIRSSALIAGSVPGLCESLAKPSSAALGGSACKV